MRTKIPTKKVLGIFTLSMINMATIVSLRSLPMMAKYGLSLIFYFTIASLIFFIPSALIAAELASTWPKAGIYTWVKEAFGKRIGFLAVFLQWGSNILWYPMILSFIAGTFAFSINPQLANNKYFVIAVVLISFWASLIINFFGMKISGLISSIGAILGSIIPSILIIIFGVMWLLGGNGSQIDFSLNSVIPDINSIRNLALLTGIMLGLMGIEMPAVHAKEVKNPQRDYPKAILITTLIIILIYILGSLSISIVVPKKEINLVAGVMEAFLVFFAALNLKWLTPIMAVLISVGILGAVSTWIIGPSKGLLETAKEKILPSIFSKVNKQGIPIFILLLQGILVTALAFVFLLTPTVSSGYWILTALTTQLYLFMYILMFISAVRLRYLHPKKKRPFKVPGGRVGIWLVASGGIIASLFAIFIGFFPPPQLKTGSLLFYEAFLFLGIIIVCTIPFLIYHCRRKQMSS